ncbi:hypothetical protein SAMN02927921_01769 [Sinomicrobium oceani]|uniref:Lipoprotein n=1 Tax=Sinomicrobium oceani TaxID=1150368 RepID=A0A1K1PJ51_9FLAO|nr:hypothetical protein [Sinomicrobium oceani]SFW46662.1 hypothetical protein SAMN02927921_01769 [Sinomicrobium oceani]
MKTNFTGKAISAVMLILVLLCLSCTEHQPEKVNKPKNTIDVKRASKLSSRFVKELDNLMQGVKMRQDTAKGFIPVHQPAFEYTSHTYYSLDELEHYFAWAKQEAKAKGYTLEGFRFYFGVYPETEESGEKQNVMTLFISPAGKKARKQESAFVNMPLMYNDVPDKIMDIDPYNYGGAGDPPKASY